MQNFLKVMILLFLLIFSLAGCSDIEREKELQFQINMLREKNLEIQKEYDELKQKTDRIKTKADAAAVAQGCDWLISLCPTSLVTAGRQAIVEGYIPNPILFWFYALFKFTFLVLVTGTFYWLISYIHFNFNMPSSIRLKKAEEVISNATNVASFEKASLQAEIGKLEIRLQELEDLIYELDVAVGEKSMYLKQLSVQVHDLTVIRDALEGI